VTMSIEAFAFTPSTVKQACHYDI